MLKFPLFNQKGFSLVELTVGMVITGIVGLGAFKFFESSQKAQVESTLKAKASSEIMSFLQSRRKSIAKANPVGAIDASSNLPRILVIKKKVADPKTLVVTDYYEKIEVTCDTPAANILPNLPGNYKCQNLCGDANKAPMYITVSQKKGSTGAWSPGELYPSPKPNAFLDGNQNKIATSLCMNFDSGANLLKLTVTYLIRPSSNNTNFQSLSQTIVVEVPKAPAGGQSGPEVLGSF